MKRKLKIAVSVLTACSVLASTMLSNVAFADDAEQSVAEVAADSETANDNTSEESNSEAVSEETEAVSETAEEVTEAVSETVEEVTETVSEETIAEETVNEDSEKVSEEAVEEVKKSSGSSDEAEEVSTEAVSETTAEKVTETTAEAIEVKNTNIALFDAPVEAKDFTIMFDDVIASDGALTAGILPYSNNTVFLNVGQNGETDWTTTTKSKAVTVDGTDYNAYRPGARNNTLKNGTVTTTAEYKDTKGTYIEFKAPANGVFITWSTSIANMCKYDFDEAGNVVKENTSNTVKADSSKKVAFTVLKGHTYVVCTTGATNSCEFAGVKYLVDSPATVNITVDGSLGDAKIKLTDETVGKALSDITASGNLELTKNHTYSIKSSTLAKKLTVNSGSTFDVTENGQSFTIKVEDAVAVPTSGKLTSNDTAFNPSDITKITFVNMENSEEKFENAVIAGDSYSVNLLPGKYNTVITSTSKKYTTRDRIKVVEGDTSVTNEIYCEAELSFAGPFKSELNVGEGGDYKTVSEAVKAIKAMSNRPAGEDGRVTINLLQDFQEQVLVDADYVTINGNNHEINWYYSTIGSFYSPDENGYYQEYLFRDKYEIVSPTQMTKLWGRVVIVTGDYFKANNTTFKNTFNYEVTDKEIEDGATDTVIGKRAKDSKVQSYKDKERSNALYTQGNHGEVYNCKILASQDTLGMNGENKNGEWYFKDCTIGGNVDYICGGGTMIFDNCKLQWKTYTGADEDADKNGAIGYICAPKSMPYIFRNCEVTTDGNEGTSTVKGKYGRTWGAGSKAVFSKVKTNGYIDDSAWGEMNSGDYATASFLEYSNTTDGTTAFNSTPISKYESTVGAQVTDTRQIKALASTAANFSSINALFVEIPSNDLIEGDVTGDKVISATDAAALLKYTINGGITFPGATKGIMSQAAAEILGDVDESDHIDATDSAAVLHKARNPETEFSKLDWTAVKEVEKELKA